MWPVFPGEVNGLVIRRHCLNRGGLDVGVLYGPLPKVGKDSNKI